ncbi:MAG TPA: inositol monophosphatase [Candidatus Saccharimonadales bacterium]|nr:inositol monophosphatase [Candidatus Saccharimonadales bacterium]
MSNPQTYLAFATDLAHQAGEMMRAGQATMLVEEKSDGTPVTAIDLAINDLVIQKVKKAFPEHGIAGEEASHNHTADWLWVCDPIDGTVAFIAHLPVSAFSLALVHNGEPVVAVIYNPWTDTLYSAVQDQGAWRNGIPMRVSTRGQDPTAIPKPIITAKGYDAYKGLFATPRAQELLQIHKWHIVHCLGIAYKGCLVAEGALDGAVYTYTGAHDIAALQLIVTEAGGRVTDVDGKSQRYDQPINGAIISNGVIHDKLQGIVAELQKSKF